MLPQKDLAIKKALENNWEEAAKINQEIVKANPQDTDALNRLAFSLMKLGKYKKAKEIYKKVIEADKSNPIATKNLKKLESFIKQHVKIANNLGNPANLQELFIEEPGKTKIIELKNVADKKTLSLLEPGKSVRIVLKRSKCFIQEDPKKYIGMLPDSIGMRLIRFIKGGNLYQAYIRSVDEKNVSIFIKETKRVSRFKTQPSFTSSPFLYHSQEEQTEKKPEKD